MPAFEFKGQVGVQRVLPHPNPSPGGRGVLLLSPAGGRAGDKGAPYIACLNTQHHSYFMFLRARYLNRMMAFCAVIQIPHPSGIQTAIQASVTFQE